MRGLFCLLLYILICGMEEKNSIVVVLGAEITDLQKKLSQAGALIQQAGQKMQDVGANLSASLTAPIALFGAATLRTAGNFEAAMNTVQALSGATGKELEVLTAKARELGATTSFSATEAAQGMETLLKNGLNVQQVMGGALDATLGLAAATKTSLANAADIATDAMLQFGLQASDLAGVVDKIAGVTVASKFGIDDVRLALANAGGVAGAVGVEFEDFAVAIAATSSAFSSGADAGTSLKTFLTSLNPKSKEAAKEMQRLGLTFFDSSGKMDSMSVIAQKLQNTFGKMSEQQKIATADTLFGADAMRTALLLAQQGEAGFNKLAESIGKVSAAEMAAIQMKGFNGALKTLSSAFEAFQISLANSGMLNFFAGLINSLAGVFQAMSQLRPEILTGITIFGGLLAAIGPVLLIVGKLAVGLPALWATMSTGLTVAKGLAGTIGLLSLKIIAIAAIVAGAIAAIVAIGVAIKSAYDTFEGFRKAVDAVGQTIQTVFSYASKWFMALWETAREAVGAIIKYLGSFAKVLGLVTNETDKTKKLNESIGQLSKGLDSQNVKSFGDAFKSNFGGVVDFVTAGAKKAKDAISSMLFVPQTETPTLGGAAPAGAAPAGATGAGGGLAGGAAAVGEVSKKLTEATGKATTFGNVMATLGSEKAAILNTSMTSLLTNTLNPTNAAINKMNEGMVKVGETITTIPLPNFREQLSALLIDLQQGAFTWEKFELSVASAFTRLGRDVAQGGKDLAAFARAAVNSIRQVISALIAEGIAAVVSKTLISAGATGPVAVAIAAGAGAAAAALFNTIIPAFADGGIVSGPTIGLMGEYPGARSNPEVIAPLSKLQDMIGQTGPNMGEVVDAINNNPPTNVFIDKNGFATSIERNMNRNQIINNRFNWSSK